MRIAFATCAAQAAGRPDDLLAGDLIGAELATWDDPEVDWTAYDRVVIRSVWDYTAHHDRFLAWSAAIGPDRLRNSPELVVFNSDKLYLGELKVPTVTTTFLAPGETLSVPTTEIVVKPNVSAGGRDTGRFEPHAFSEASALVEQIHATGRTALVQPYLPSVDSEGETAIVFFGGELSHALHKKPVLREAGVAPLAEMDHAPAAVMLDDDLVTAATAGEPQLELAHAAHAEITARFGEPLYLRVDIVSDLDGNPVVMELEAIEPNLYLGLQTGAAERFADAIVTS